MNGIFDRRTVAEFIIILAVCVGAWMLIVEPKVAELGELEASIAEADRNPVLQNQGAVKHMASQLDSVRQRVRAIAQQNEFGRDSSSIYGLIMSMAKEHGVTVDRLDPGSSRAGGNGESVQVASFDMRVQGRYEPMAAFLDAIENIDGFVRPVRLTIAPRGTAGEELVEARFMCEALTFTMPEALTAMVGDDHADQ
ncbi:MAG: type II secretion system protein M [Planctomycetes bacterium]|nr:type II secretion system protein M [Planctomycetota bacterium]